MAAQSGRDLLIKIDMDGAGQFQTVAGLRATRITLNAEAVDITNTSSLGGWRELLGGAGVKTAALSGSGVFKDADTDARIRQLFFDGQIPDCQIVIPDFGVLQGAFMITSIEYAGNHNGAASYDVSFASAGAIQFTPDQNQA